MNEKRMKISVNIGEVSLPPGHAVGWGVKAPAQQGGDSEKQVFGVGKLLEKPCDGRIIAKTTGKNQFAP
jgi:hypothetical protein